MAALLAATIVMFFGMTVLGIMLLTFPSVFVPLVEWQNSIPATSNWGGQYSDFHLFTLLVICPLVFMGMLVIVSAILVTRTEAHRARL